MNFRKTISFTLAETLIVMGVIGIVSALTLPNLNSSTGQKEKVAKVKKIYQNLSDALGRAEAVYGPLDEWFINDSTPYDKTKRAGERITEFMKISKSCPTTSATGCMTTGTYKNISGTHYVGTLVDSNSISYLLADGTALTISSASSTGFELYIDIDGPNKGEFKYGVDLFRFSANKNKGIYYSSYGSSPTCCTNDGAGNFGCEAWIIENENMDYLKADKKTGKCPNGKVLSNTVTSCK